MYPVLESVFKQRGYDEETKLWYLFLYTTFYHVGSAERVFEIYPQKVKINPDKVGAFETGVERRGFRGNLKWVFLVNELDKYDSMIDFVSPTKRGGMVGWKEMRLRFEEMKNNGAWSSYKFADLLAHVMHYPIEADDLGTNPSVLECAEMVLGLDKKYIKVSGNIQNAFLESCKKAGVMFTGLDQLETCLCDFHTVLDGRYYVGNDIDMNMKQIPDKPQFWKARQEVFNHEFLGEKHGYIGERKPLKKKYLNTGKL